MVALQEALQGTGLQRPSSYSIVVPVCGNQGSLIRLADCLAAALAGLDSRLDVVFVIDGSPDRSGEVPAELLPDRLPRQPFASRLVFHSRNFGSFAAIRTGSSAPRRIRWRGGR